VDVAFFDVAIDAAAMGASDLRCMVNTEEFDKALATRAKDLRT
jgi:hypothetical protein